MTNHDCFWKLSTLSDQELEGRLEALVSSERSTTARLVAHLAEVLERRLHLTQAYPTMTAYCREKLHLKEDDAGRRIVAARLGTRYPVIFPMLDSGELSLSVACKLKHYIHDENHRELLEGVRGLSYREAESWLALRFPRVDVPSRVRRLASPKPAAAQASAHPAATQEATYAEATRPGTTPAPVAPPPSAPVAIALVAAPTTSDVAAPWLDSARAAPGPIDPLPPRPRDRGRVEPISPARYRIEFTAGEELKAKLDLARDLMSHSNPSGDFAPIVERALDLLVAELEKKRFGMTKRPKRARSADPGRITNAVRREVAERDELRCTYVDGQGKRCNARAFLQHDHKLPRGLGGTSGADNVRDFCAAHNQLAAERVYGRSYIARAIAKRRAQQRKSSRGSPAREEPPHATVATVAGAAT
jgi:hypothetical protein